MTCDAAAVPKKPRNRQWTDDAGQRATKPPDAHVATTSHAALDALIVSRDVAESRSDCVAPRENGRRTRQDLDVFARSVASFDIATVARDRIAM
jgi:hypothetical protein